MISCSLFTFEVDSYSVSSSLDSAAFSTGLSWTWDKGVDELVCWESYFQGEILDWYVLIEHNKCELWCILHHDREIIQHHLVPRLLQDFFTNVINHVDNKPYCQYYKTAGNYKYSFWLTILFC